MKYDLVIIGSGPGGYSAALRAHKLGAKFVLIEKEQYGGVCLNRGCIPTKTMLKSALIFREIKKAEVFGINVQQPTVNFEKVLERKNKVVSALRSGINAQIKAKGIAVINGEAKVTGIHEVCVGDERIETENIIIATGSASARPPIKGIDDSSVIFSDEALTLSQIPTTMVIIGGGVIGVEFATLYNEFGCKVCIIEMKERIIPETNEDVSNEMRKILTRAGIEIITSAQVKSIEGGNVVFEKDGEIAQRYGEKVLVSTGRKPNIEGLFDDSIEIQKERGYLVTDKFMRTSIDNIYAVGDVIGKEMLAHVATAEGIVAAENALGISSEMSYEAIPRCIYSFPESASVGIGEKEAQEQNLEIKVGRYPVRSNGRALADGNIEGFSKIITEQATGKILGLHLVSPYATEMISEGTMAVKFGIKDIDFARLIHPHPTVSEIIEESVFNIL